MYTFRTRVFAMQKRRFCLEPRTSLSVLKLNGMNKNYPFFQQTGKHIRQIDKNCGKIDHLNHLQRLYVHVQPLKASFVRAQNITTVWNHCHPWQFWSNSFNFSAGFLKKCLMRLPSFAIVVRRSGFFLQSVPALYL